MRTWLAMCLSPRASKSASAGAPVTSIPPAIRACRVMCAANSVPLIATTASTCSPIPTRSSSARSRSMSTRSASPRANCGAPTPRRAIPSTSIYGTITLSQPDSISETDILKALPPLPRDAAGPVFAEPWQAQAFALAVKLSEQGHFTWKEWAATLAAELQAAADRGEPDDGSQYYQHWLAALERLVAAKGLADPAALLERKQAWAEAYRRTPHGKPVELTASSRGPEPA